MLGLRGILVRRERTGAKVEVEVICTVFHAIRAQFAVKY